MLGIISQCQIWSRARRPCVFPPLTLLFDICYTVLFSGVSHRQYVFISWRVSRRRRINLSLRLSALCVVYNKGMLCTIMHQYWWLKTNKIFFRFCLGIEAKSNPCFID